MLYPLMSQTEMKGEAEFFCPNLKQMLATAKCLDWYVDHNALKRTESPCYKCDLGLKNRQEFAGS